MRGNPYVIRRRTTLIDIVGLDERDTRALLEAATRLMADPPPEFDDVLATLRSLIRCRSVSFNDMAMSSGDYRYLIVPPDEEPLATELKPVYDRFAYQHPLVARALADAGCGAIRFCDVPEGRHFTETELYRQFYAPFDLRYQLVMGLPSPPDVIVGYALNRTEDAGEFSDRDVAVLNALAAHLAMHHRTMLRRERSHALETEADRNGWAVATVRSDGTIEESSASSHSTLLAEGRRVPIEIAELLPVYGRMDPRPSKHDLTIDDERWRCVIRALPVGPTVVMVRRLGDRTGAVAALDDAGLTRRQADVARALAETGGTNAQLAQALGLSPGTVKKHLEAVFRTLGVDSRAAAVVALQAMLD